MTIFYDDRGHCPKCGKFCGDIKATLNEIDGIKKVKGKCKTHGVVDLSKQSWAYEDFDNENGEKE